MNVRSLLGLYSTIKHVNFDKHRFYCSRNILKLHERGMYEDIFPDNSTNEIVDLLLKSPQCVYAGFDPTANSLHIGNLLILMNLLHWQRAGHQVVALVGGATGLIGDPSHRKSERVEIEKCLIEENVKSIRKNIETIFNNHAEYIWKSNQKNLKPLIIVNNLDWYTNVNIIDFVRNIGKYFRMGTMLGRSSVQSRLNSDTGMSFTEFSYQIFQAYDWFQLMKKYKCRFQIGGSDQMGNIMSGYDLVTKTGKNNVYGMTLPLITAEGGKKFGKSLLNAVWLCPTKSSSFQLYQYFVRTKDSDVEKFLKLFTFIPLHKIKEIVDAHMKNPEERIAQKLLAEQVTLLVHGENGLLAAKRASAALYDKSIESFTRMEASELMDVFEGATITDVLSEPGLTIYDLARKASCFKTDHDAQRIITAGGFYINHQRITNLNEVIVPGIHILSNNLSLIRVGKKTYHIVRWQ